MSPRVPTVEYARSERSSAKSSQAARNSALSCPRSEALRLRQAGPSLKNVNLTNVRSATRRRVMATALAAGVFACLWATPALGRSVTLVALPQGTTVGELTRAGLSPGVMSAGIGPVPAEQTYLDISQGNRVDDALYDRSLPPLRSIGARDSQLGADRSEGRRRAGGHRAGAARLEPGCARDPVRGRPLGGDRGAPGG